MSNESRSLTEIQNAMGYSQGDQQNSAVSSLSVDAQRAMTEAQIAHEHALRYPRRPEVVLNNILLSCQITAVAEEAEYVYNRGGKSVRGPSIRIAELVMREWGHMKAGIRELSRGHDNSLFKAYARDIQTNAEWEVEFVVPHYRDKESGTRQKLTSDRDIYEIGANMGSRRVRECILRVIPNYIVEAAIGRCQETLEKAKHDKPLKERVRNAMNTFNDMGVTDAMIQKWLGRPVTEMIEQELISLRRIGKTIKDGVGRIDEYFEVQQNSAGKSGPQATSQAQARKPAEQAGASEPSPRAAEQSSAGAGEARNAEGSKEGGDGQRADVARASEQQVSKPAEVKPEPAEQKAPQAAAGSGGFTPPDYDEVMALITKATTPEEINDALSSIHEGLTPTQRTQLRRAGAKRTGQLSTTGASLE